MQFASTTSLDTAKVRFFIACSILAVLLLGFTFHETLVDLNTLWQFNNEAYSHGYLVLGLVLYVLYERRELFVLKPTFTVLPFALCAGLAWTATNAINVKLGEYLILPAVLFLLIVGSVGWHQSLKFLLPVSALYFALPIVGFLNPILQTVTVKVVTEMVRMTDMVAHIDGFYITLPYGVLHVADSCSGLSYLSAGITFTMLYAFLNIRRKRLKALAIMLMMALSLFANWLRVFILVVIGHESKMQSPLVKEHGFLGWIIFACIFVLFLFVMRIIENKYDSQNETSKKSEAQDDDALSDTTRKASYARSALPLFIALVIAAAPLYLLFVKSASVHPTLVEFSLPSFSEDAKVVAYKGQTTVSFESADQAVSIEGTRKGLSYNVFAAAYVHQRQGKELIHYKNKVGVELTQHKTVPFDDALINYAYEAKTNSHVFWFYRIGETEVTTDFQAKFAQLRNMLGVPKAMALIVKVSCDVDCELTEKNAEIKRLVALTRQVDLVNK